MRFGLNDRSARGEKLYSEARHRPSCALRGTHAPDVPSPIKPSPGSSKPEATLGIDDWAWRKGSTYGTIVVDLERREVVDVLPDRSTVGTVNWLEQHPEIEIVSRDRCGSLAQGAHEGAPRARQVADRFHIRLNLREAIQTQLSRAAGSSVRPLLPTTDGNDEPESMITCSSRDKHGGAEHRATSPGRPTGVQGKPSLIGSAGYLAREKP
jgi:Transposase